MNRTELMNSLLNLEYQSNESTERVFYSFYDKFITDRTKKNLSNLLCEYRLYVSKFQFENIFDNLWKMYRLLNTPIIIVFPIYIGKSNGYKLSIQNNLDIKVESYNFAK